MHSEADMRHLMHYRAAEMDNLSALLITDLFSSHFKLTSQLVPFFLLGRFVMLHNSKPFNQSK